MTSSDRVAVLGCGAVGLGAIAAAAHRRALTIAVDVDDATLALAVKAGAGKAINTRTQSLHDALQQVTGGDGPDVVIEAIGMPETYRAAIDQAGEALREWDRSPAGFSKIMIEVGM